MSATAVLDEKLIVRARVTELFDEFFGRVDRAESVADLLTEDSRFRGVQGRAEVTELLLGLAKKRAGNGRTSRHFSSNVRIDRLDDTRYRVRALVVILSLDTRPDAVGELVTDDHDDIVEIDADGVCRFAEQNTTRAFQLGVSAR